MMIIHETTAGSCCFFIDDNELKISEDSWFIGEFAYEKGLRKTDEDLLL
jgi:hypothetical protein